MASSLQVFILCFSAAWLWTPLCCITSERETESCPQLLGHACFEVPWLYCVEQIKQGAFVRLDNWSALPHHLIYCAHVCAVVTHTPSYSPKREQSSLTHQSVSLVEALSFRDDSCPRVADGQNIGET